jgi:hypothetical protein
MRLCGRSRTGERRRLRRPCTPLESYIFHRCTQYPFDKNPADSLHPSLPTAFSSTLPSFSTVWSLKKNYVLLSWCYMYVPSLNQPMVNLQSSVIAILSSFILFSCIVLIFIRHLIWARVPVELAVIQQQSDLECVRDDHSYVSYATAVAVRYSHATDSYFALFD